jgi:gliding motility-associated-like protein
MGLFRKYILWFLNPGKGMILLSGIMLLLCSINADATHLVGGSITYKYLGKAGSKLMFRVTVDMFRDCSNPAGAYFDKYILISVYERKANAFGDTAIIDTLTVELASVSPVSPPSSAKNCTVKPNTCLQEGLYNDTLLVSPSAYGYYLETQRCCRNTMLNVPDGVGQTYFAIIPPTNIINSTPVFNAVPSPYMCAYDTVNLNYSAYEPDGDSLVYVLARPWAGGNSTNLIIPPPASVFSTIPLVPYNTGYSPAHPLGTGGYADIDMFTGVLTLYAPGVGRYAIAVDVYEYRNKSVISVTRRDVQIITVSGCPKQSPPVRIPIVDSLPIDNSVSTTYIVQSGHRLSFNIRYKAYNSNVTRFSATGFFNQPGIFTYQPTFAFKLDSGFATAYLNWQTTCKEGRTIPYTFTVAVTDTGCPSKTTYQGYKIFVYKGSDHIAGVNKFCSDTPVAVYSTNPPFKGDSVYWKVTGGIIKSHPTDSSILIAWGTGPAGLIQVMSRNDKGCVSDTVSFKVKISPKPKPPKITGPVSVCPGVINPYAIASSKTLKYTWKVTSGNLNLVDTMGKQANITWNADTNIHLVIVAGMDSNGCFTDTSVLNVIPVKSFTDTIFGESPACPNTSGHEYWIIPKKPGSYFWKIEGGTQTAGGNGPKIVVKWGSKGTGIVKVYEQVSGNCFGDTISKNVIIDYNLAINPIAGDTSICEYSRSVHYSVKKIGGYRYKWAVSGGTIVTVTDSPDIHVNWAQAGTGIVSVQETGFDTLNNQSCASTVESLNVILRPIPAPSLIQGPLNICENDSGIYRIKGSLSNVFTWKVNGKLSAETGDSIIISESDLKSDIDSILLEASENSAFNCPGPWRTFKVRVHRLPQTSPINGDAKVCFPNLTGATYHVSGAKTSTFKWTVDGGVITTGNQTDAITVDWQTAGNRKVTVQEFNDLGCAGPVKEFNVQVDSLAVDLKLVTTEEANEKYIDIFWSKKNDEYLNGYFRIYRSQEGTAFYRLIDSVPHSQTFYIDKHVNTTGFAYRYRIEAVNSCGYIVKTKVHRSVRLSGNYDRDTTMRLKWNRYEGWPVEKYNIMAAKNADTSYAFYGFTSDTSYIVIKTLEGYQECFRIAAKKTGINDTLSWSNKICFDFDPILWIPDVFTPNGDFHNNTFHVFASNYKTYRIDIYNRWGGYIFTSTDPAIQWDGKYQGNNCPEGVYLYIVNLLGAKDLIYRSGTVTLLR